MGKMFLSLKLVHFKFYMYLIVVTNRQTVVIAAELNVITLVVNISTSYYNWKGLMNKIINENNALK